MQSYQEFLDLSVGFPQEGFEIIDDELILSRPQFDGDDRNVWHSPALHLSANHHQEDTAGKTCLFQQAIIKNNYRGTYKYCYCTKSSHFRHIVEEALKNDIHLETSSAFRYANDRRAGEKRCANQGCDRDLQRF
jgi:arginine decarboxylase